jgi:hypothetical protein
MKDLLDILPDPALFWKEDEYGKQFHCDEILDAKIKELHKKTNCPACILAVLRQKGIPITATNFDFTKECKSWWIDVNLKNDRWQDI